MFDVARSIDCCLFTKDKEGVLKYGGDAARILLSRVDEHQEDAQLLGQLFKFKYLLDEKSVQRVQAILEKHVAQPARRVAASSKTAKPKKAAAKKPDEETDALVDMFFA